jgi:hypothetical protein
MPLPAFNDQGDLPPGVHRATLTEVAERFGRGTPQRQLVTGRLKRIYELAQNTGQLSRCVVFGSYVTAKPAPNDVDIILVMQDDFREPAAPPDARPLFNHQQAQQTLGASVFWVCPAGILLETVDDFLAHWQVKRDLSRRGIVEIVAAE